MPSPSGRPRSTSSRSGLCERASISARCAVVRLDDAIVLRLEQHAQHVADAGVVLDDEHLMHRVASRAPAPSIGSVNSKRAPPLGTRAAHRSCRRARARSRGRSRARARRRRSSPSLHAALKLVEQALRIAWRQARAVVVDRDAHDGPSLVAATVIARAGRRVLGGVVEQIARTPARRAWHRRTRAAVPPAARTRRG